MNTFVRQFAFAIGFILTVASCASNDTRATSQATAEESAFPPLPDGVWEGTLTHRNIPDVDHDGEWQHDVSLIHCSGEARIRFKQDDGEYGTGFAVEIVPLKKMYLLTMARVDPERLDGWIESQVWTLVDATPGDWTIVQSRAVLNQDMKPSEPWHTFRRLAWGSLKYQRDQCPAS